MGLTQTQLDKRAALYTRWQTVDTAISNAIASGVTSVNVSTGTGTKSFTKISLTDLRKERASLANQIAEIDSIGRPAIKRFGIRFH
jgi:hypothetical protein